MNPVDVVEAYKQAVINRDEQAMASYVSDDFQFSGPVPEPLGKDQYLGLMALMMNAFPDIDYGMEVVGSEGDTVYLTHTLSGTHTNDFDLTAMGMGVIPASNRTFSNATEEFTYIVEDGLIVAMINEPTEGAGMPALLAQITGE